MIFLIAAAYLLFIVLTWRQFNLAISLIIFLLPSYLIRFNLFILPFNFLSGLIWLIFLIWLIKSLKQKTLSFSFKTLPQTFSIWPTQLKLPTITFLIAALIALFISPSTLAAIGIFKAYIIEALLFITVIFANTKSKTQWQSLITPLLWLVSVMGLLSIIQRFTGIFIPTPYLPPNSFRTTLFFGYPNAGPLFIAPLLPIFLALFWNNLKEKIFNQKFYLYLTSITLGLVAIILAKSVGAIVGLVVGLFIFFLFLNKKSTIITGSLAVIVLIIFLIIPAKYQKPITNDLTFKDWSGQVRLFQWRETNNMLKDHWLTGVGLANYQTAFAPYHQAKSIAIFMYPHNIILNFWSELGLLGVLSVLWLLFTNIKQNIFLLKNNKIIALGFLASIITLIIHGLVDVPFFKNDLAVLWWLIIIAPFIYQRTTD